ncbi:hypothetical protein [Azorhizophilus paspali]|uniref:hypothetical protein n=1 Tax=Azorhizophilus paspali TaxID=69963 RepID=UPI003672EBBC
MRQLAATIQAHIGAGGDAHRAATATLAGFLSASDKARYDALASQGQQEQGDRLSSAGIFTGEAFGVIGGPGRDETQNILAAINAIGDAGGELVIRAESPGDPIYINAPLPIEASNLTLRFRGTLLMGPNAYVRVNGGLSEIVRPGMSGNTLALRAPSTTDAEGRMVLPLRSGLGAFLQIDDKITIRGQNDKFGKPFSKQVTTVVAISGDNATCADEPGETWLPTYPDSDWPPDHTTGTTIGIAAFSALTVDAVRGDVVLHVANTSYFSAGKLVYISDSRTEADFMAPVPTTLRSQCNMEIARVVAVDAGSNTVTLDRGLSRGFPTAWGGGVALMEPVENTHIVADRLSWDAPQPNRRNSALAINYASECTIQAAFVDGRSGRLGAAARIGYSYDCQILNTAADGAYGFGSAEGYGLTLYYSTLCAIRGCHATGGRHNYLLQSATLCTVEGNYSGDDFISGIDLHGANSVDCVIRGNLVQVGVQHAPGVTNSGGIRNGNTSHTIGDHGTIIEGNVIVNYRGTLSCAIDVSPSSRDVVVRGNVVIDVGVAFRHYKVSSSVPNQHSNRVVINGNYVLRAVLPVDIENYTGNSFWDELIFTDNEFVDCGQSVLIEDIPRVIFSGNRYRLTTARSGEPAFDFRSIPNLRVQGNEVHGAARGGRATNCGTAAFVRNWFGGCTEGSTVMDGGGNTSLLDVLNGDSGGGGGGPITTGDITDYVETTEDLIGSSIVAGTGITKSYDDATGKTTISATGGGANALTGLVVPAGDSRSNQNWSYTNTVPALLARSPLGWFELLSRRVRVDSRYKQCVPGYTVAQLRALFEADTPNEYGFSPSEVPLGTLWVLRIGTNDIAGGTKSGIDTALVDHQWIVDWMTARGDTVFVVAEWPRVASGNAPINTTGQQLMQYYREEIKRRNRGKARVYVVDVWPRAVDPASTTGDPLSTPASTPPASILNPDGLHNSPGIAFIEGEEEARLAEKIGLPIIYRVTTSNADLYHATNNPDGNIHPNPMLLGSDTASGANSAGIEPTSWDMDASTGLTATGSRETITFFDGERERTVNAFKMVISGTAGSSGLYGRIRQSGLLSQVASGNSIEGGVEYVVDAGHNNLAAVGIVIDPATTADQVHGMVNTGGTNGDQPMPAVISKKFYGCTRSPKYTVPGTLPASLSWDIRVRCCVAGPFSATVWFISTSLRKVPA